MFLLFILFTLVAFANTTFAKSGINVQAESVRLSELRFSSLAKSQDKHICEVSLAYKVPYTTIVSILSRQYFYYGFEDGLQDLFIGSGSFFNEKDERRLNKEYVFHKEQDRLSLFAGNKSETRNSSDSYLFSSLGPAQIQIYMGLKLSEIYPKLDYTDMNSIAKALSSKQGSIEFLTAELKFAIDTYSKIAKVDISHNTQALWQLHNAGSIEYRAKERYRRSLTNNSMSNVDGVKFDHPEITKHFESTGYACFND